VTGRVAALAAALALLPAGVAGAQQSRVLSVEAESGVVTTLAAEGDGQIPFWAPLAVRPDGTLILSFFNDSSPGYGRFL
jgi:hypothetical protein